MTRHDMRGYLVGAIAFITCLCHLPLTLPVALALTAGTAIGGWLAPTALLSTLPLLSFGLVVSFYLPGGG